jgi:peroxiredoxin
MQHSLNLRLPYWAGMICLFVLASCHHGSEGPDAGSFTLTGTLKGADSGLAVLRMYTDSGNDYVFDTAKITQGRFTFSGKAAYPKWASLSVNDQSGNFPISFFLDPGTTTVMSGNLDSLDQVQILGGATETEFNAFQKDYRVFDVEQAKIESTFEDLAVNTGKIDSLRAQAIRDSLERTYSALDSSRTAFSKQYIKAHPDSYVSLLQMHQVFNYNPDVKEFDSAWSHVSDPVKASDLGKGIAAMLAIDQKTDIGQVPPDFTSRDVNGKPVTLSAYTKGKVVLLDFWASWCHPCRLENPNVVQAYKDYHSKGFTVLGVSLDDHKEAWVKAIAEDHLIWTQVSDLKGPEGEVVGLYGVRSIPMNYLVGSDGRIVAKGIRGKDLQDQLAKLLK